MPVSQRLFYGTKLERRQKQCYMWITGDRRARGSGKRIGSIQGGPGKSQGSFKTIPCVQANGLSAGVLGLPETGDLPVNFESGERRWQEA